MNSDKFKKQIESMWKHRDTDEQKRLVKFTIAKTMRLTLEYPELAQEYFDSLCKVIPDNERITISNYQHNLTSDAEGEEMLTVPRKKVQEKWQRAYEQEAKYSEAEQNPTAREELYYNRGIISVIDTLFGSKCLPDEPSKLQASCRQVNVDSSHDNVDSSHGNVDSLEPKPAEPNPDGDKLSPEPQPANRTPSSYTQPVTDCPQIDRLHIAAMAMQGILSNTDRLRKSVTIGSGVPFESFVARKALRYADALVAESHK